MEGGKTRRKENVPGFAFVIAVRGAYAAVAMPCFLW